MSLVKTNRVKVLVDTGNLNGFYKELEEYRLINWKESPRVVLSSETVLKNNGDLRKWAIKHPYIARLFKELGCTWLLFEVVEDQVRYLQVHFEASGKHRDSIFKEDCVTYFGICEDIDLTYSIKAVTI